LVIIRFFEKTYDLVWAVGGIYNRTNTLTGIDKSLKNIKISKLAAFVKGDLMCRDGDKETGGL
jgi:hypothetical protein